jgi:histidinol dehydrogenase
MANFLKVERFADLSLSERAALFAHSGLKLKEIRTNTIEPLATEFESGSFAALKSALKRFEGGVPDELLLNRDAMAAAAQRVAASDAHTLAAFKKAAGNIENFHKLQRQTGFSADIAGNELGVNFVPFDRVALYVPGGKALYPSTVLMGVLPARIAGVQDISVLTPPDPSTGRVSDIVLAMAHEAGATRVLQAGGAQAIFSAAYGVPELGLKPVDFIYGPGNLYVSAAKIYAAGENLCGIDSFAGPSEVVVIADETANARYVAHDLMAQAEHDENAQAILLTTSPELATRVSEEIEHSLAARPDDERRKQITLDAICRNGRVLITDNLEQAVEISNQYAPEHLEIQTARNEEVLATIRCAGSIFVGDHAPVAAGDYYTGTNHILPTAGAARFTSGVSVYTFYRRITWQKVTRVGLEAGKDAISAMSTAEGLFAEHGYSVLTRFQE